MSYTCLISALARRGRLPEAAGWLAHMRANTSIVPDATTFNTMVAGYSSRAMWQVRGHPRARACRPSHVGARILS